jgi:hypothetical protein
MAATFTELRNVDTPQFKEAIDIYLEALPASERQTVETIKARVGSEKEKMFIGSLKGKVVLTALVWPLQGTEFALLDYMAVKKDMRNCGLGSEFVKNIHRISGLADATFILEVEDPKEGVDVALREMRIRFYRRNGALQMQETPYMLPALHGTKPTRMIIMTISPKPQKTLEGKVVTELFRQIFREVYLRSEKDEVLNSFIDHVPPKVAIA